MKLLPAIALLSIVSANSQAAFAAPLVYASVPEVATIALLGVALVILGLFRRKRSVHRQIP